MSFSGWQKVINGTVEGIAPVIISASRATDIPQSKNVQNILQKSTQALMPYECLLGEIEEMFIGFDCNCKP